MLCLVFAGCSTGSNGRSDGSNDEDGAAGSRDSAIIDTNDAAIGDAAMTASGDAAMTASADAAMTASGDGAPMRAACKKQLANKIGQSFGRLDGYLTAITAPGNGPCFADPDHVHLQVTTVDGSYDIAVNVNDTSGPSVEFKTLDVALPDGAWSEGWHSGDALDYAKLGLHSKDFTALPPSQLAKTIASELASANHLSVFATPYSDGTGAHDVHRKNGGNDGALVVRPTDGTAHMLLFHFQSQTF
ncbi:MAG: hypothetical protein ABI445_16000 [Polyangia bacterium]